MEEQHISQRLDTILEIVMHLKSTALTREEGATKKDLEAFATKDDMQHLLGVVSEIKEHALTKEEGATKTDLEAFATKTDLEAFATKDDINDILEIITHLRDHAVSKEEFDLKIGSLTQDIRSIRSTMVTKNYLDEKLANHRADLNILMRKGDTKLKALVGIVYDREVIDEQDLKKIYEMEPFPAMPHHA